MASTPSVWPSLRDAKEQKIVRKATAAPSSRLDAAERQVRPSMPMLSSLHAVSPVSGVDTFRVNQTKCNSMEADAIIRQRIPESK